MTKAELERNLYDDYGLYMSRAEIAKQFRMRKENVPVEKFTAYEIPGTTRKKYDVSSVAVWIMAYKQLGVLR